MKIIPQKGKLIYALMTRQDGMIYLPDTAKSRSASSVVVAINDDGNSGLHVGDIILHNMKWSQREADGAKNAFYMDDELHKVMFINDAYAKVIEGNVVPLNDWLFCKMILPKHIIDGAYKLEDCNTVQLASCGINGQKNLPIKIGAKYLIAGWDQSMQQFNFGKDCYVFLKVDSLIAEVSENPSLN